MKNNVSRNKIDKNIPGAQMTIVIWAHVCLSVLGPGGEEVAAAAHCSEWWWWLMVGGMSWGGSSLL
jgi:hypothetical protein